MESSPGCTFSVCLWSLHVETQSTKPCVLVYIAVFWCSGYLRIKIVTSSWVFSCHRSVAKSCPTLCNPMDCTVTGFPVLHYLLEFAQISHPFYLIISFSASHFSFCLQSVSASGLFPIRWPGYWSFSFSNILPMNIQGCFPLGWTGLISLQSKGVSRVFSRSAIRKHQSFGTEPFLNSYFFFFQL